jgi:transposase InsO family protein
MGSRYERWLKLEEKTAQREIELSAEQVAFVKKHNPCFKERHVESSRPVELLNQDAFFVGHLKGVGKVYLHDAVVDTYCSFAFGFFLHVSKQPEAAVAVLHNEALPFYSERGLKVENVLTDNGREFCGGEGHPYQIYLALNEIGHRTTKVKHPQTNGFVERFNSTMLDEFFGKAFRQKLYESVEALQQDLDEWLYYYNHERPHQGYRNEGRRPIERIEDCLQDVRQEG